MNTLQDIKKNKVVAIIRKANEKISSIYSMHLKVEELGMLKLLPKHPEFLGLLRELQMELVTE